MDSIQGVLLNGIFGFIFAVIGYVAVIKAAKIEAEATRYAASRDSSRSKTDEYKAKTGRDKASDSRQPSSAWSHIHWSWWLTYLAIMFTLLFYAETGCWQGEVGFITLLAFILIGIPALSFRQAYRHPLPWKTAVIFIALTYFLVYVFATNTRPSLYTDLYEDVPLWAWTFGNIGGVVVLSLMREQEKRC